MYPKGLQPSGKLQLYSQMFSAVEVDQSFYDIECLDAYKSWLTAVPDSFRFSLKTPRSITHEDRLRHPEPFLKPFLDAARRFGDALGPILVQLPPWFGIKQAASLQLFLDRLPLDEMRFAVEVRDWQLWSDLFPFLLEQYPFIPVTTNLVSSPSDIRMSNGTAYIRWLGPRRGFEGPQKTPERFYEESFEWSQAISSLLETGDLQSVYVFVDHEYFGPGVIGAARLRRLLGDPVHFPGTLF